MRSQTIVACVALGLGALGINGCTTTVEPPPPAFDPGPALGQAKNEIVYPAGPYGVGKGSTIPNFDFIGYANAVAKNDTMQAISLSDFYNKHGRDASYKPASPAEDDRLFPAGSQYGEGTPKPTVLAIDVASMWCGPCNLEAKCDIPGLHAQYAPCGGGFLLQLQDNNTPGTPAAPKNLFTWAVKEYKEDFTVAIDPEGRLGSLFAADAFPANFIIDLTTMKIVEAIAGVPDKPYWDLYETLLADPSCPAKQTVPPKAAGCP
jgi:hypothetical protein